MGELMEMGVFFENDDLPGCKQDGDIYSAEGMKTAWFKNPGGNILSLIESSGG